LRLYLEPSVLVKLFKREEHSTKMIDLIATVDDEKEWFACTSRWSLLEITRALRKDGKPKEMVELDLKELKRHRITFLDVTRRIIAASEKLIASSDLYASDALHAATYASARKPRRLEAILSDDRHFRRLSSVKVLTLAEAQLP
jgi:predicted nucleic acid-binding protein